MQQEGIHRRAHFLSIHIGWHDGPFHRLEGPILAVIIRNDRSRGQRERLGLRCFCSLGNPLLNDRQFRLRHLLSLLRHFPAANELHHFALVRLSGHEHVLAFIEHLVHEAPKPQIDSALRLLLLPVTMGAMRLHDGAHIFLESEHSFATARKGSEEG